MSTMNWKDPETKVKFLMSLLAANESIAFSNAKASQVATVMGCTAKAVLNQLTSLRKEIEVLREKGNFDTAGAAPPTPKSAGNAKKRGRAAKKDDEDGNESPSPSKKAKASPKKGGKKKKSEEKIEESEAEELRVEDDEAEDEKKNGEVKEETNGEEEAE